jgi:Uma2 family endonuclease
MPSPVTYDHSEAHFDLMAWLGLFEMFTPGVKGGDNGSLRLDLTNMPQPDAYLRILERHGGRARLSVDRYVEGSPEWIGEIAVSSIGFDLTTKLEVYRKSGVSEYMVCRVPDGAVDWFVLRGERFEPLPLTPPGWYRSEVFRGLWLDPAALVKGDMATVAQVAQQGIASAEHADFVTRLQAVAEGRQS